MNIWSLLDKHKLSAAHHLMQWVLQCVCTLLFPLFFWISLQAIPFVIFLVQWCKRLQIIISCSTLLTYKSISYHHNILSFHSYMPHTEESRLSQVLLPMNPSLSSVMLVALLCIKFNAPIFKKEWTAFNSQDIAQSGLESTRKCKQEILHFLSMSFLVIPGFDCL